LSQPHAPTLSLLLFSPIYLQGAAAKETSQDNDAGSLIPVLRTLLLPFGVQVIVLLYLEAFLMIPLSSLDGPPATKRLGGFYRFRSPSPRPLSGLPVFLWSAPSGLGQFRCWAPVSQQTGLLSSSPPTFDSLPHCLTVSSMICPPPLFYIHKLFGLETVQ